ncbi:hypothetical protein GGI35DRAFT_200886 [Trichoderma velutinum]
MSADMSVSNLTQQCLDKLHEAMSGGNDTEHQDHLENRLAGFNLWVDNVGALAKSGASLDSRFRSRPDDLELVKNILSLLSDFLDEYIDTIHKGLPIEEPLLNVDSAIRNLAKIGVAIRRTGKASRSRRAYQSFKPDEHDDFKQHLECLILLRPDENHPELSGLGISSVNELIDSTSDESSEKNDVLKTKLEQLAKSRMEDLNSSKLNEIQKRLVEANLRRRHNFLLAQKRSQRTKKTAQTKLTPDKHQPDTNPHTRIEVPLRTKVVDQANVLASLETQVLPTQNKLAPTVTGYTVASTAEGTLQFNLAKSLQRAPTVARSQISFIAANTEFPRPPSSSQSQLMFKCPCCCQSLPSEDFTSLSRWRHHLIEDICPYTCIAQSCPTPDKLFTTRKAWELHFENDHSPQWQCMLCNEDDEPFSSEEDITAHTLTQHKQELSKYELSFLLSSAEVRYMGIESCPLCSSHGPRDSTELVDHVVRHAYEFALRALPWPQPVKEDLNKPIGTFSLPEDTSNAEGLGRWLDSLDESAEEVSVSSFDKLDHTLPEKDNKTIEEDYFANNDYFEDRESADSSKRLTAQGRSSIISNRDLAKQNNVDDATLLEMDLHAAVLDGDPEVVRSLIEERQMIDSDGEIRKRALMIAIQGGHIGAAKQLLRSGIDKNSQDEYGRTALFFAAERNDIPISRFLIKAGIDAHIEDHDGLTALHIIIQKGDDDDISALFTLDIYQRFADDHIETLITWARQKGHLFAVQTLREVQEKSLSALADAQRIFGIEDRDEAAKTIIHGSDWYALIDPLLDLAYLDLVATLPHEGSVEIVCFSHDGKYVATGTNRGIVQIFDVETRRSVRKIDLTTSTYVFGLCFVPNELPVTIVSGSNEIVEVRNVAIVEDDELDVSYESLLNSFDHRSNVYALETSKDGSLLASGGGGGTVRLWDLEQGVEVNNFAGNGKAIFSIKISPDGRFLAEGGDGGDAFIWDLTKETPEIMTTLQHGSEIRGLALSSDGRYLVTGGVPSLKIWDLESGTLLSDFGGLESLVTSVSMTPDDRWITAASSDGTVRFWDWRTARESHCILVDVHTKGINHIAVSPLGGYFATVSNDENLRIWSYGQRKQT